jgi:hypothetical protein
MDSATSWQSSRSWSRARKTSLTTSSLVRSWADSDLRSDLRRSWMRFGACWFGHDLYSGTTPTKL